MTTQMAGSLVHSIFPSPSCPSATPFSTGTRSDLMRAMMTCVSGSPKRALYSSTFGPASVIISPA